MESTTESMSKASTETKARRSSEGSTIHTTMDRHSSLRRIADNFRGIWIDQIRVEVAEHRNVTHKEQQPDLLRDVGVVQHFVVVVFAVDGLDLPRDVLDLRQRFGLHFQQQFAQVQRGFGERLDFVADVVWQQLKVQAITTSGLVACNASVIRELVFVAARVASSDVNQTGAIQQDGN